MRGFSKIEAITVSALIAAILVLLLLWNPRIQTERASTDPLVLYCAAGIRPPVADVVKEYESELGVSIRIQYGGSGTLLGNLRAAQTGDLYLAGDASFIQIARERNLVEESIPLATMRPVIATSEGNPKRIRCAQDLSREDIRVALANPDATSVGKQTRIAMTRAGLWEDLQEAVSSRGVLKPTVNDVANDIKIGTVDAGVVWDSTAKQYTDLEIVAPLSEDEGFVTQVTIGVLRCSKQPSEALRFARYLSARDRGLKAFDRHHYAVVEGDLWAKKPEILLLSGGVNRPAIEQTLRAFEKREGCQITRVYNGCGILVAQMKAGERPDAYFACDVSFMRDVQDMFDTPVNVSETDILIAVQQGNPKRIGVLDDLATNRLKLGVANPEQSALGALTRRMLNSAGLLDAVMKNVRSQTPTADLLVNQLRAGGLDAVIVYEANIAQVRDHLDIVRIDLPGAKAIQPFAVAKFSQYPRLTHRLLEAIASAESQTHYETSGFRWLYPPEQR